LRDTFGDHFVYAGLGTTVPLAAEPLAHHSSDSSHAFAHASAGREYRSPNSLASGHPTH
jgi:hypothetical protein